MTTIVYKAVVAKLLTFNPLDLNCEKINGNTKHFFRGFKKKKKLKKNLKKKNLKKNFAAAAKAPHRTTIGKYQIQTKKIEKKNLKKKRLKKKNLLPPPKQHAAPQCEIIKFKQKQIQKKF